MYLELQVLIFNRIYGIFYVLMPQYIVFHAHGLAPVCIILDIWKY